MGGLGIRAAYGAPTRGRFLQLWVVAKSGILQISIFPHPSLALSEKLAGDALASAPQVTV